MDPTPQEKKFLQHLGRTEDGRDLLAFLKRAKEHYSSITGIDPQKGEYGAQVEGRRIFITFVEDLERHIRTQPHKPTIRGTDDYT